VVATIASATLFTMYTMLSLIAEFDATNYVLTCLIHIQRADSDFSTVDLSSANSVFSHFRELCASFGDIPRHMLDEFFDDVSALSGEPKDEAHKALREACEGVHEILVTSKGREPVETATEVITKLDQAIVSLVDMLEGVTKEDGEAELGEKSLRNQRIRDQIAKDPASRSSDYEVVG